MKSFALLGLLLPFAAQAGGPGVITLNATLTEASNPNGHCGASSYGYTFDGTYTDAAGVAHEIHDCVESVAVPLNVSKCLEPKKFPSDMLKLVNLELAKASGVRSAPKVTIAVSDVDSPDAGTILSIESDCK